MSIISRSKYTPWDLGHYYLLYYFKNRSNHLIIIYPPQNTPQKNLLVSTYAWVSLEKIAGEIIGEIIGEYAYWDVTLGHVVQVCHLLACVAMLFFPHYPIQGIPIYQFSYIILQSESYDYSKWYLTEIYPNKMTFNKSIKFSYLDTFPNYSTFWIKNHPSNFWTFKIW